MLISAVGSRIPTPTKFDGVALDLVKDVRKELLQPWPLNKWVSLAIFIVG